MSWYDACGEKYYDSLIGSLLKVLGNNKDGKNSHLYMVDMGIWQELALEDRGKELICFWHVTLYLKKKKNCECLHGLKVPQVYSSNIKKFISMKYLKLIGLKSHYCHVLMQ